MSIQAMCDSCGSVQPIDFANAGATIPCQCGEQLKVPKLSELKRLLGHHIEPIAGIADQLRTMYLDKQLPPDTHCMFCQAKTAETLECWVECERSRVDSSGSWETAMGALQLFISPIEGLIRLWARKNESGEAYGNDLVVRTPLPICENCLHKTSRRPAHIRGFLRSVALYRQLLDTYPGAQVGAS